MTTSMTTTKQPIEDRLYLGNLHYNTTEEELRELFKDYKLTSLEIPFLCHNKGTDKEFKKYLGFGFAQFETKEDADKALEAVSGTKINKRTLQLRKAVPKLDEDEKKAKVEEYRARVAAQEAEKKAIAAEKKQKQDEQKAAKQKAEVSGSEKIPQGKASSDTIFVTNLNYKVGVRELYNVFHEYKPKWIHVPSKRVQTEGANGAVITKQQNKCIAFVKFSSQELQKKAVDEFNGHVLYGRPLVVDVAVDARGAKERKKTGKKGEQEKE